MTEEEVLQYLREHVHVDKETGCHVWAGAKSREGYPRIMWKRKVYLARRLLMTLNGRMYRQGWVVFDSCGNRLCMNEAHLHVNHHVKAKEAARKKGCYVSGVRRSMLSAAGRTETARLGVKQLSEVLRLRGEGKTYKQIGEMYGVHPSAVGHMLSAWKKAMNP